MADSTHNLINHTQNLFIAARKRGLSITHAREIDVMRSLQGIDLSNRDDYRLCLRANLVSSREEELIFERTFHAYWDEGEVENSNDYILAKSELLRNDLVAGRENEGHKDMLSEVTTSGEEEVTRRSNLISRWDSNAPPLDKSIDKLAKYLATRPSRRHTIFHKGRQLDMRNTIRKSIREGQEISKLIRRKKKVQKTRIILLCDVSGSMDVFNAFLLQLMFGIQKKLRSSKTFVFSTKLTDVTNLIKTRSTSGALENIANQVRHWSGGTNICSALATLNRGILREGKASATTLILISDGYDSTPTSIEMDGSSTLEKELKILKRRIRHFVWINPMYGASTFEVRAAALKTALPHIDFFLPAYDAKALHQLIDGLSKI